MNENDPYAQLVAAQFSAAISKLEDGLKAHKDLENLRYQATRDDITDLKDTTKDHENRIRSLTDSATQFKFLVYLATGGGLMGAIVLIRELIQ